MDHDLMCNFRKCRKRLSSHAWVTSCSHIFCDEDGTREFNKSHLCPACGTNLTEKYDVIQVDLQPSEQYKSIVMAGMKPEVIMEMCSRALSFWTYQTHQERMYQEYVANRAKEKISNLEQYYEQLVSKTQTQITLLKTQISNTTTELDQAKKQYNEVSEKLIQKNRQYHKLQGMYDSLKRKTIAPGFLGTHDDQVLDTRTANATHTFDIPICTGKEEFLLQTATPDPRQDCYSPSRQRPFSREENNFSLNFVVTPGITKRLLLNKERK